MTGLRQHSHANPSHLLSGISSFVMIDEVFSVVVIKLIYAFKCS
jgi:hypothetical protein